MEAAKQRMVFWAEGEALDNAELGDRPLWVGRTCNWVLIWVKVEVGGNGRERYEPIQPLFPISCLFSYPPILSPPLPFLILVFFFLSFFFFFFCILGKFCLF